MTKIRSTFSFLDQESFMAFAHRGANELSPENTLESFSVAYTLGFKNFELDVHASSDGEVFVCHDDNLERFKRFGSSRSLYNFKVDNAKI